MRAINIAQFCFELWMKQIVGLLSHCCQHRTRRHRMRTSSSLACASEQRPLLQSLQPAMQMQCCHGGHTQMHCLQKGVDRSIPGHGGLRCSSCVLQGSISSMDCVSAHELETGSSDDSSAP